jgi:hypothetical protein
MTVALAPVNVVVVNVGGDGEETYETNVGLFGQVYDLRFDDLMNLIRVRCGFERKRLEYRPAVVTISLKGKQ